ncbi:hypothetical protein AB0939_08115 [Streptomyces sp. NPDC006990]|uniref:hypothetical protein n=1 Tax=Streptomyces sp. NPDC006990 TaxID=3154481 RepID=UPI003454D30A
MRALTGVRVGIVTSTVTGILTFLVAPAEAGIGDGKQVDPPADVGPSDRIQSRAKFTAHNSPKSGTPMAPVGGADWAPPGCWYEPQFTAKEFQRFAKKQGMGPDGYGRFLIAQYGKDDFRSGEAGSWWKKKTSDSPNADYTVCPSQAYVFLDPKKKAPADIPALSPKILAGLAYEQTRLPAPPVRLSPATKRQIVNLDTHVRFDAPQDRVWVTASIDYLGLDIAATTIATPKSLNVDAGTHEAAPRTCTYDLEKVKGGYQVDSKGADCNISYERASGDGGQHGTYPFTASLVWDVTWTDSASPDGPPVGDPALPDGQSTYEQDVTVKEIQSVVRD